jgi:hypothetical protein
VGYEARRNDKVRPLAEHLAGDVDIAALGVTRGGLHDWHPLVASLAVA